MSNLTIQWPDANAEQVEAAKGRLDVARRRLVARSPDGILSVLGTVLDQWRKPASKWRQRFMGEFPALSGFSPEIVSAGLDLALEHWTGDALAEAVRAELDSGRRSPSHRVAPFSMTSVLLAGAIPMPSLLACLLPLCVQSPVLVKSASRDPITPNLLAGSIAEVDPELGRCMEVVSFPGSDRESLERFLAAECVVASGSDETIQEINQRVRPSQRFVAYGHKLSIAVVRGAGCSDDKLPGIADALALDVALWDQLGCLSPVCVFVVGDDARGATERLSHALADALAREQSARPRGEVDAEVAAVIRHEREEARMRAANGAEIVLRESEGSLWTVVGEADATWRPNPLHRFVRVHPVSRFDELPDALTPVVRNLSSVALAGFDDDLEKLDATRLELSRLGVPRLCPAGRLLAPPIGWHHDGLPVVLPLTRFSSFESSGP